MARKKANDLPEWLESVVAKEEKAKRQANLAAQRRAAAENPVELMPVAERFVSVNGEGTHQGRLAAFVRFPGCNLRCAWCDTSWAQGTDAVTEWRTADELARWVRATNVACVTLTGGEPLLQPGLAELVEALLRIDVPDAGGAEEGPRHGSFPVPGLFVEVETNGSQPVRPLTALRERLAADGAPGVLGLTVDCKLPASGEADAMNADNYALLGPDDAVKFVIGGSEDLEAALEVMRAHDLADHCHVLLSPVFGAVEPAAIVDFMKEHRLAQAALQLQVHKIIWPGAERGV